VASGGFVCPIGKNIKYFMVRFKHLIVGGCKKVGVFKKE
jgi:hypothetical protein